MKKCVIKGVISVVLTVILVGFIPTCVCAAETPIDPKFDYKYYADTYADLKAAFGYDQNALWNHYVEHGQYEKRSCYKGDPNGTATNADASTAASQQVVNVDGDVDAYVDRFFQIYLKSASHRKNILKSDWKYYGGAFITNYNGKCYNIQIFAN